MPNNITSEDFIKSAKQMVAKYLSEFHGFDIAVYNVFVVWYCKELKNHKAILGGYTPDTLLFEVAYNGDRDEFYFDAYQKVANYTSPR